MKISIYALYIFITLLVFFPPFGSNTVPVTFSQDETQNESSSDNTNSETPNNTDSQIDTQNEQIPRWLRDLGNINIDINKIVNSTKEYANIIILAFIAFSAIISYIACRYRGLARYYKEVFADARYSSSKDVIRRATRIVVLGAGGVGKTTLVKLLSGSKQARPDISTNDAKMYSVRKEVTVQQSNGTFASEDSRLDVAIDYRGQQPGQAITAIRRQSSRSDLPPITTLVLLVDLFPPPQNQHVAQPLQGQIDTDRVTQHLTLFTEQLLQICVDQIEDNNGGHKLRRIIVLINKIDLYKSNNNRTHRNIVTHFSELLDTTRKFVPGRDLEIEVWLGALSKGLCFQYLEPEKPEKDRVPFFDHLCAISETLPTKSPQNCAKQLYNALKHLVPSKQKHS